MFFLAAVLNFLGVLTVYMPTWQTFAASRFIACLAYYSLFQLPYIIGELLSLPLGKASIWHLGSYVRLSSNVSVHINNAECHLGEFRVVKIRRGNLYTVS